MYRTWIKVGLAIKSEKAAGSGFTMAEQEQWMEEC